MASDFLSIDVAQAATPLPDAATLVPLADEALAELIARDVRLVRQFHRRCSRAANRSLDYFHEAGIALLSLEKLVPHGQWQHFVRKTFRGAPSLRMAEKYMCLARGWGVVAAKTNCSSFLTLNDACRLIAQAKRNKADDDPPRDASSKGPKPLALEKLAEAVLGEVDLDPSTGVGDYAVLAKHSFTAADGLSLAWHGRVFLSPPKGRELPKWIAKLKDEYPHHVREALVLVAARTDTQVFHELAEIAACLAFLRGAVAGGPAGRPMLLAYLGNRVATFVEALEDHATVLFPRP